MRKTPAPKEDNVQAPLGPEPTYDEVLDTAVEYTFPCSDPIAVDACCGKIAKKPEAGSVSAPPVRAN